MPCFHPFFEVSKGSVLLFIRILDVGLLIGLEVVFEVLKKRDFLLQVLWVVLKGVLADVILAVIELSLHVFKIEVFWVCDYLCGVVEKHARGAIGEEVAQSVFAGVVDPLLDENLGLHRVGLLFELVVHAAQLEVVDGLDGLAHGVLLREGRFLELVLVAV